MVATLADSKSTFSLMRLSKQRRVVVDRSGTEDVVKAVAAVGRQNTRDAVAAMPVFMLMESVLFLLMIGPEGPRRCFSLVVIVVSQPSAWPSTRDADDPRSFC
jgi:hypothetical protein